MTVATVARAHYADRQALTAAATRSAVRSWRRVSLDDLDASWNAAAPRLLRLIASAQVASAASADTYTADVLAAQGLDGSGPAVRVEAFAGVASDGRPLETLAYQPIIEAKTRIGGGEAPAEALRKATGAFGRIVAAQVADAGRVADGVAVTGRTQVTGYYRRLQGSSCDRCVVLAGRWFRWSSGFQRHRPPLRLHPCTGEPWRWWRRRNRP